MLVPATGTKSWSFCSLTVSLYRITYFPGGLGGFHMFSCGFCSSEEQYQPSFYKLENGTHSVCLATDFSQFRQLANNSLFNQTEAVQFSQESLFSQVAFITEAAGKDSCTVGANCGAHNCGPAAVHHPVAAEPGSG